MSKKSFDELCDILDTDRMLKYMVMIPSEREIDKNKQWKLEKMKDLEFYLRYLDIGNLKNEYYVKEKNDKEMTLTLYTNYDELIKIISDTNWYNIMIFVDDEYYPDETLELRKKLCSIYNK